MAYVIDPRKNWALAQQFLAEETDPRRRCCLETLIAHAKAEAKPDFDALMATVATNAKYTSYAPGSGAENSPTGKQGVAAYYQGIVSTGCNQIEHAVERIAVGRDTITTEGDMKMAFPGAVLQGMGMQVPEPNGLYVYLSRLIIVWVFDEEGLVLCEDSYSGGEFPGFEGIAERPIGTEEIYAWGDDPAS